jgi:hypothetical protein
MHNPFRIGGTLRKNLRTAQSFGTDRALARTVGFGTEQAAPHHQAPPRRVALPRGRVAI